MIFWLTLAARQLREDADAYEIDIASQIGRARNSKPPNQSTISRFESGKWSNDTDETIRAYARELDIEPMEIWARAVELWRSHLAGKGLPQEIEAAVQARERSGQNSKPAASAR